MHARQKLVWGLGIAGATVLGLALTSRVADAQDIPLSQLLPELILREIVVLGPVPGLPSGALSHVAHFSPIEANEPNNPAVAIVQAFNSQIATQFATFPLGSSTGGLTYVFDESLGTLRRGSSSFGPLFAERALTIGRGKFSAGFNYQRTSYDTFEGENLDDGSIKFYLRHQDCCGFVDPANLVGFMSIADGSRLNPPFEGDIIEASLSANATTHTAALFANYGVTDRWDVGLAVPFVRVNLDASVDASILRLVTDPPPQAMLTPEQRRGALNVHTFEVDNPSATRTFQRSGRATGLGDIVLRTKYRFLPMAGGGLAAAVDVRLPTGDEEDLLGTGGVQAKFLLIASTERGRLAPHVNFGYTLADGEVAGALAGLTPTPIPDEVNYSGGLEFVASPRVTLIGDVVGRTLRGAGRLSLARKTFEYNENSPLLGFQGPGCGGFVGFTCRTASLDEFAPESGNLTLVLGTAGIKFNPTGDLLVTASVLFPMTKAGLRSRVTTVVGIDYAF
jgi:hypothetical protein